MKQIVRARITLLAVMVALLAAGMFSAGCGGSSGPKEDALTTLKRQYMNKPEFSVMMIDMKEEGSFSKKYAHKYKIVSADTPEQAKKGVTAMKTEETDWVPVNEKSYKALQPYLGMTILSKKLGGEISQTAQPGGYMYVGNQQYGHWGAGGEWIWAATYASMMTTMFMMDRGPINRGYYDDYNRSTRAGRPYFGNNNTYGTNGTMVKNSSFFANQRARMSAKKSAFADKARSRSGRTTTPSSSSNSYSRPTSRTTFRSGGK